MDAPHSGVAAKKKGVVVGNPKRVRRGSADKVVAPLRSSSLIHTSITTPRKVAPTLAAPHETPGDFHGYCSMQRDKTLDSLCQCPDLALQLTLRAATLATMSRSWKCLCCDLPVDWSFTGIERPRLIP